MGFSKFVVLSSARSGSNYLLSVLNNDNRILSYYEIFNQDGIILLNEFRPEEFDISLELRSQNPIKFLYRLISNSQKKFKDKSFFGFKMFPEHGLDLAERFVKFKTWKKIILYRENRLASYSSLLIARQTQEWHSLVEANSKPPLVEFSAEEFSEYVKNLDAYDQMLYENHVGPVKMIEYKSLGSQRSLDNIVSFIVEEPTSCLKGALKKQNSSDILSRFSNPEVAVQYLLTIGKREWESEEVGAF